jgi:hypothetical protein
MGDVNVVGLYREIVVNEFRRLAVVRQNPAHLGRSAKHGLRLVRRCPIFDLRLPREVLDFAPHSQELAIFGTKAPTQSRANHATVTGHPHSLSAKVKRRIKHHGPVAQFRL